MLQIHKQFMKTGTTDMINVTGLTFYDVTTCREDSLLHGNLILHLCTYKISSHVYIQDKLSYSF